jgi:hypothetical protein
MRWLILVALVGSCGHVAPKPTKVAPPAEAPLFDFRVGFWINLHQRLFAESGARTPAGCLTAQPPEQQAAWNAAVEWYRRRWPERSLGTVLTDEALVQAERQLAVAVDAPSGVDPELAATLLAAAPVYRTWGWPADETRDRALIAALQPALARDGDRLGKTLPRLYGANWPERPLSVEVSRYAGPVGAYTLIFPTLITLSSGDPRNQGDAALEVLFHEASHALAAPLRSAVARLCPTATPTLWHAALFYLTGAAVQRAVGGRYQPYAERNGLYQRGDWNGIGPALASSLGPYLDGAQSLDRALAGLCAAATRR